MIWPLFTIPALAGLAAFFMKSRAALRTLLVLTAVAHIALVITVAANHSAPRYGAWIGVDALAIIFLFITSVLFLAAAVYAVGYLAAETPGARTDIEDGELFSNEPEAVFVGCLLFFLASMTLVITSRHMGLLWAAVEATTLASAPLIFFHRHHRSMEAAWKYLMICSVGIGLALLGNLFIAAALGPSADTGLVIDELAAAAPRMNPLWLKAGFIFLLVGYGTKMGLAPLHTWLPDAHSESPSVVSALLSGALLNCAFLGILRAWQLLAAAGLTAFAAPILVAFGLFSIGLTALFLVRQTDYKRLLAYSSIEHMGVMALGVGLGGIATYGALLHAVNHSMAKAALFLVSGNLLRAFRSKQISAVTGSMRIAPASSVIWLCGAFAITGMPPFGVFVSEFTIIRGAIEGGHIVIAVTALLFLGVAFAAIASSVLSMVQGEPPAGVTRKRETLLTILPPAILAAVVLMLGLYVPPFISSALHKASLALEVLQ